MILHTISGDSWTTWTLWVHESQAKDIWKRVFQNYNMISILNLLPSLFKIYLFP